MDRTPRLLRCRKTFLPGSFARAWFEGVIVTDALDMHAIRQGELLGVDAVRAADAGADLLLVTSSPQDQERVMHP